MVTAVDKVNTYLGRTTFPALVWNKRENYIYYGPFYLWSIENETKEYSSRVLKEINYLQSGGNFDKTTDESSDESSPITSDTETIVETASSFISINEKQSINTDQNTFYVVVDGPDWITACLLYTSPSPRD